VRREELNQITHSVIGAAMEVHRALGPGLLESAYQECLSRELTVREIPFERERPLPLEYKGIHLPCGYRLDLLVAGAVVVEVKSVEASRADPRSATSNLPAARRMENRTTD
jgi:GxxExxY protein